MWCSQCGATVPEGSQFCGQCGRAVAGATIAPGTPPPPPQPFVPAPTVPTSSKALASLITGIFGLIFFLPAIAAIILGHMSRSEIRRSGGRLQGDGLAIAGLVMGYGSFVLAIPIVLIIAAIAIPNLLRARMAADEVECELVFVGLIGMIDPARPEVKQAVHVARRALANDQPAPEILLTGPTTVANLFFNMASGKIGLVGLWDAVGQLRVGLRSRR